MTPQYFKAERRRHLAARIRNMTWVSLPLPVVLLFGSEVAKSMPLIVGLTLGVHFLAVASSTWLCRRLEEFEKVSRSDQWERLLLASRTVVSITMLAYTVLVFKGESIANWSTLVMVAAWSGAMEVGASSFHSWVPLAAAHFGIYGLGGVLASTLLAQSRSQQIGMILVSLGYLVSVALKARQNREGFVQACQRKYDAEKEHERLAVFMDMLPAKIAWLDRDKRYILVNRPYAEAMGKRKEEFVGERLGFAVPKASSFMRRKVGRFYASGRAETSLELPFPAAQGEWKRHLYQLRRFQAGPAGAELFVVAVDVDEKSRVREQIEAERAKTAQAARMANLGEMAAGIAHEIRNPLAILMGNVQMLKRDVTLDPIPLSKLNERADRMEHSGQRIVRIIDSLKNLSRDSVSEPSAWHPLVKIIEDPVMICSERFRTHQVEFGVDLMPPEYRLRCQPHELAQVILNLLNNAFDATESQARREVRIEFDPRSEHPQISVCDNGPGVADPNKLFLPFYTTKAPNRGTGLGLSISGKIMSRHGGQLLYERRNGWTKFILRFAKGTLQALAEPDRKAG